MINKSHIKIAIVSIVKNELELFLKEHNFPYNGNNTNIVDVDYRKKIAKNLHKRLCLLSAHIYRVDSSSLKSGDVGLLKHLMTNLPLNGRVEDISNLIIKSDYFHRMCYNIRMFQTKYIVSHRDPFLSYIQNVDGNVHVVQANVPTSTYRKFLSNKFHVSLASYMKINSLPEYADVSIKNGKLFGREYKFIHVGDKKIQLKFENIADKPYGWSKSRKRYKLQRTNQEVALLLQAHLNEFGFVRDAVIVTTRTETQITFDVEFSQIVKYDPQEIIAKFLKGCYGDVESILPKQVEPMSSKQDVSLSKGIRNKINDIQMEQTRVQQNIEAQKSIIEAAEREIELQNNELKKHSENIESLRKALSILNN